MKSKIFVALMVLGILTLALNPQPAQAQLNVYPTMTFTTLTTAITDANNTNTIAIGSIGSGSTGVIAGTIIYIDGEAMTVKVTPTAATAVQVTRHTYATRGQTHAANSLVYYGNPNAFVSGQSGVQFYQGQCTVGNFINLPIIDTVNGFLGNCTNSQWRWFKLNAPTSADHPYTPVTAAYTAKHTDEHIGVTTLSGALTITLPAATGMAGHVYVVRNESTIATNTIWVTTSSTQIDGSASSKAIWGTSTSATSPLSGVPSGVMRFYSNGSNYFTW